MQTEVGMYTYNYNNSTVLSRDPMFKLEQEMRLRNFSPKTIRAYLYYNKELLRFTNHKSLLEINRQDIKDYLDYFINIGKSTSTVNLAINAVKFYYDSILGRKFFSTDFGIKRPKKEKRLPVVLSKEEIIKMISSIDNIKHKLIIQILYTSGLRVSEIINLNINYIDFYRKTIFVKGGKGKKDRITIISEKVLENINKYLLEYKPITYIFENMNGRKISQRTVQKVVLTAAKKAGINKNISPHTLRHSFATHQIENGVNLRYVQAMLGHARLETTQIYTKVAVDKFSEINDLL